MFNNQRGFKKILSICPLDVCDSIRGVLLGLEYYRDYRDEAASLRIVNKERMYFMIFYA